MKIFSCIIAVVLSASGFLCAQSESQIRDRIVGTWKLVSAEYTMKDGSKRPYGDLGPRGKGFLIYAADGYMCADLVNPDRLKWADVVHPKMEERLSLANRSFAYCGRYEIDATKKQIVHLPKVASRPDYVDSRQVRPYKFEGGGLVLSDVETEESGVVRWKIVWEKVR
jgi:hypothetical protein